MEGVNSFVKFFNLAPGATSAIELQDTTGTPIFCNWFRLSLNNTIGNSAKVILTPDGLYTGDTDPAAVSGASFGNTSGIGGFIAQGGQGDAVEHIFLANASSVTLQNVGDGGDAQIGLSYGVIGTISPLKGVIRSTGS